MTINGQAWPVRAKLITIGRKWPQIGRSTEFQTEIGPNYDNHFRLKLDNF